MPMMMSIIMTSFPPNKRATVMGVAGIAMGFAPNIGPTIGGYLVTASGWRSLFVILAICMIVLIICACVFIVRSPRIKRTASLDVVSVILSALGFGFLLLGFRTLQMQVQHCYRSGCRSLLALLRSLPSSGDKSASTIRSSTWIYSRRSSS